MNARCGAGLLALPALLVALDGPGWVDPLPAEVPRFRQLLLSIRLSFQLRQATTSAGFVSPDVP
jgi:hypothetical protein